MIDEEPLIWMCCLQIVIILLNYFFFHPPNLPFFRPPIPPFSPLKLKNLNFLCRVKQLMRFVWSKMNLPSGLCRLHIVFNYPAVRFVLCSYCTTSSVMSAEQVVIGVRHFQVDIFSVPERRKKRDKDETLATLHFFFSECLKRVYFCEVY